MAEQGGTSVVLRRERTRNALCRLAAAVERWLDGWSDDGPQTSQIARCGHVLRGLIVRLGGRAAELPTDERAFALCRRLDGDLVVVERLWRLLAERFDQRRDPARAPVLRAADDLIWSCLLQTRPLAETLPPLPLAYLEPAHSASATPRVKPPPSLPVADRQLAEALRVLPVPLVGLPVAIGDEPWWLTLIAHEVGHHVHYDLDAAAIAATGDALEQASGDPGWQAWRHEVFADAFSVVALGPAALATIAELEWDGAEAMAAGRAVYPPVMLRLALMAEVARALGFSAVAFDRTSWQPWLAALAPTLRARLDAQLAHAAAAARALLDLPVGKGSLARLADRAAPAATPSDPEVAALRRFLGGHDVAVSRTRPAPRRAIALAFERYRGLASIDDAVARDRARATLRAQVVPLLDRVGDRAVVKRAPRSTADDTAVVDRILDAVHAVEAEAAA